MDKLQENNKHENGMPTLDQTSLSLEEKLRIAIETLLTGRLKDNHDDTLLAKFCSLLQDDLEAAQLSQFVAQQNIFTLIKRNLQALRGDSDSSSASSNCAGDLMPYFQIVGSLFSHSQVFSEYMLESDILCIAHLVRQTFASVMRADPRDQLLLHSLISFMKCVAQHDAGIDWLLSICFRSANDDNQHDETIENELGPHLIRLAMSQTTHYIRQDLYRIIGSLIERNSVGDDNMQYKQKFSNLLRRHVSHLFDSPEACRLLIGTLQAITDKATLIAQIDLIHSISEYWRPTPTQTVTMNQSESEYLLKLSSIITIAFSENISRISNLIAAIIAQLRSSGQYYALLSYLTETIMVESPIDNESSIRDLWQLYMEQSIGLICQNYITDQMLDDNVGKSESNDHFVRRYFDSVSYHQFECNCLRILNKIPIESLRIEQIQSLMQRIDANILSKIKNRKNVLFIITFLDDIARSTYGAKSDLIIVQVLQIYSQILPQLSVDRQCLITKSLRTIFATRTVANSHVTVVVALQPILRFFAQHLKHPIDLEFEPSELIDIIAEATFYLILHFDCLSKRKYMDQDLSIDDQRSTMFEVIEAQICLLAAENLDASTRASIVSSLYCLRCKNAQIICESISSSLSESNLRALFRHVTNYPAAYRQMLYYNLNLILNDCLQLQNSSPLTEEEFHFLLPLVCEFCMAEADTELECILLRMIEMLLRFVSQHKPNSQTLRSSLSLQIDCKLLTLIYGLLHQPLASYRSKMAAFAVYDQLRHHWNGHLEIESNRSKVDPAPPAAVESSSEPINMDALKIWQFFLNSNSDEVRRAIELQRDHPNIDVIDDIISTSLITDHLVMDCY